MGMIGIDKYISPSIETLYVEVEYGFSDTLIITPPIENIGGSAEDGEW